MASTVLLAIDLGRRLGTFLKRLKRETISYSLFSVRFESYIC